MTPYSPRFYTTSATPPYKNKKLHVELYNHIKARRIETKRAK